MRNLSGKMKDRLVQKFVELDHAKTDRLLELHFKYMDKMDEADEDIAKTARMLANEGQAMDEEMIYIQKMELGLFTLQQVRTKTNPIVSHPGMSGLVLDKIQILFLKLKNSRSILL